MTTSTQQPESNQLPELLAVLQRRREYCRAMLELSQRQSNLIDQGNFSELLQLIAQKQRVLDHLSELSQMFGGIVTFWKSVRDQLGSDLRAQCQQIIDESERILAASMNLEQQGTAVLSQRRDETQIRLKEIGDVSSTLPISGGHGHAPRPRFLDVSR